MKEGMESMNPIDKQAAIDAICNDWCGTSNADCKNPFDPATDDYYYCDGCGDVELIKALPSLEGQGKWIIFNDDDSDLSSFKCSLCGAHFPIDTILDNCCPHCKARMDGEHEAD